MRQLFAELPEACDNTLWVAERAEVEHRARASRSCREFPVPDEVPADTYEQSAAGYLRHLTYEGAEERYGPPGPAGGGRTARLRARRHRLDGVLGLLPGRVGPHPLRPRSRGSGSGPGRGSRRRLLRRLLPADRRPRPDPLRPALRAVPQPGPQADARHRHGLRRALPGRDDPLRRRSARARTTSPRSSRSRRSRPGRRCGTRARVLGYPYSVGDRIAKADAAARHGPGHAAVGVLRAASRATTTATRSPPSSARCTSRTRTPSG